jgi:hypothetical protein
MALLKRKLAFADDEIVMCWTTVALPGNDLIKKGTRSSRRTLPREGLPQLLRQGRDT